MLFWKKIKQSRKKNQKIALFCKLKEESSIIKSGFQLKKSMQIVSKTLHVNITFSADAFMMKTTKLIQSKMFGLLLREGKPDLLCLQI